MNLINFRKKIGQFICILPYKLLLINIISILNKSIVNILVLNKPMLIKSTLAKPIIIKQNNLNMTY